MSKATYSICYASRKRAPRERLTTYGCASLHLDLGSPGGPDRRAAPRRPLRKTALRLRVVGQRG
eukprot:15037835-Alexandrium_andersonii.AAC.1